MTTNTTEYYQLSQFPKIEDRNTILNETTDDNKKIDKALRNHHNRLVVIEEDNSKIHSSINSITEKLNTVDTTKFATKEQVNTNTQEIANLEGRVTTLESSGGTVDTTNFVTKDEFNPVRDYVYTNVKDLTEQVNLNTQEIANIEGRVKTLESSGGSTVDTTVMAREQQCINGERLKGIEWNLPELMNLVRAGQFDKFAIGDYFVDSNLHQEFAIVAKNHYPAWAFQDSVTTENQPPEWEYDGGSTKVNHIVCCPFKPLGTGKMYYHYKPDGMLNYQETNKGGYAASNLAENLANEFSKLSPNIHHYCVKTQIFENNKGAWAAEKRWMRLPTVMEITGDRGWASTEGYSNGVCGQLPLFKSVLFRILDDDWYWTADPSSFDTTSFCTIEDKGCVSYRNASEVGSVRPILVLAYPTDNNPDNNQ